MQQDLFVYGTLQVPDVTRRLIGRVISGQPATLSGYRCGVVARADFPGIVPQVGATVPGQLLLNLSVEEIRQLDRYEGELYRRVEVSVQLQASGAQRRCWVYMITGWARHRVTETPWTMEWYQQRTRNRRLTYRD